MFDYADADSRKPVRMDKLLVGWEKLNKDKYGQDCYDLRIIVSPFSLSFYGITDKEALVVLSTLSRVMTAELDEPILNVTG